MMEKSKIIVADGKPIKPTYPTQALSGITNGTVFKGEIGASGPDAVFLKTQGSQDGFKPVSLVLRLDRGELNNRYVDNMDQLVYNFRVVDLTLTIHDR